MIKFELGNVYCKSMFKWKCTEVHAYLYLVISK